MKLTSLTCPNCNAPIETVVNGRAVCDFCDCMFLIEDIAADLMPESPVDIRTTFDECNNMDLKDPSDFFFGPQVIETNVKAKRLRNLRKATGAPEGEEVWALCDTTMLHSGKKGFIMCASGMYMIGDNDDNSSHMSWEEFSQSEISNILSSLHVGEHHFVSMLTEVQAAQKFLKELADRIRRGGIAR